MKRIKLIGSAIVLLACSVVTSRAQIVLNINNIIRQTIQFNGGSDSFQLNPTGAPTGGNQFQITGVQNGVSSAADSAVEGLGGYVTGGPWSYGTITTSGLGGNTQSASVTGGGTLTIPDGTGHDLTGTINWITIETVVGNASSVNGGLLVNVTGLSYSGSLTDLENLVASSFGTMDLSFGFSPAKTLTQLSTGTGHYNTAYSGNITGAVPEPTTMISGALLLLPFGASTLRILRKNRAA
jgi:hypothetical protein